MTNNELSDLFKALSDETRIQILQILTKETQCACNVLERLHISQPTLSHHMRILTETKLVTAEKKGKWVHYGIKDETFQKIHKFLESIGKAEFPPKDCVGD